MLLAIPGRTYHGAALAAIRSSNSARDWDEIWTGPINNLESLDFFVDVQ
jgi:hypothetical protein